MRGRAPDPGRSAKGWSLDDIMRMNIDKLKERYPDGFKAEQSLHRKAGDI